MFLVAGFLGFLSSLVISGLDCFPFEYLLLFPVRVSFGFHRMVRYSSKGAARRISGPLPRAIHKNPEYRLLLLLLLLPSRLD